MNELTSGAVYGYVEKLWYRGPATIEDGMVVFDLETAERYEHLGSSEDVALDLAAIQTEQDILDFVPKWGLLWHGPGVDEDDFKESVDDWFKAAEIVSLILKLGILTKGDNPQALRDYFAGEAPLAFSSPDDGWADPSDFSDEALSRASSMWVTQFVNRAIGGQVQWVLIDAGLQKGSDHPVGTFAPAIGAATVYAVAVLRLATILAKESSPALCKGCGRPFVPSDGKQKYHSKKCGEQARYRAWYRRNKDAGSGD